MTTCYGVPCMLLVLIVDASGIHIRRAEQERLHCVDGDGGIVRFGQPQKGLLQLYRFISLAGSKQEKNDCGLHVTDQWSTKYL